MFGVSNIQANNNVQMIDMPHTLQSYPSSGWESSILWHVARWMAVISYVAMVVTLGF